MRRFQNFGCIIAISILAGCASHSSSSNQSLKFTGIWTQTSPQPGSLVTTKEVVVDGDKFLIVEKTPMTLNNAGNSLDASQEKISIFDGKSFFRRQSAFAENKGWVASSAVEKTMDLRFWVEKHEEGGTPGGLIGGRESVLYEVKVKDAISNLMYKRWFDKQTNVLLKEEYWKDNALSLITECQKISYEVADPSAFSIPADAERH